MTNRISDTELIQITSITNVELARVRTRLRDRSGQKLEGGLIKGYMATLDPRALDLGLVAFIFVRVDEMNDIFGESDRTAEALAALPSVQELHHLAGEDCFLVKVRARDTDDLYRVLKEEFGQFKSIRSTRTTIVLKTVKETSRLPVSEKVR